MRTTLDIPDPIFKQAKMQAVLEGITFKQLVNRALEREINPPSTRSALTSDDWKVPVSPHPLNDKNLNWSWRNATVCCAIPR